MVAVTARRRAAVVSARILGIDYVLPGRVVTNAEIARRHPGWHMPLVERQTGVLERHLAAPGETALDLSLSAARSVIARTGVDPAMIDVLLFCTETPDHPMPPNACLLQDRLGLSKRVAALDFTLACSGYVYGLYLARGLIASGAARTVLFVTADTYSTLISPEDRGTYTLFGDGAAATLLAAGERGLGEFLLGTDGGAASCFIVPAGGTRSPRTALTGAPATDRVGNLKSLEQIHMDGPAVLAFVVREVPANVRELLANAGRTLADIDLVIFHQASQVAMDNLQRELAIPDAKLFSNIALVGNTVSASLPIALRDAELAGRLKPGYRVLLVSFGVGLSWGSCLLEW